MADEHRRVEPRGVVGSGMLSDPERIDQLEHERDRTERSWREAPKRKFGKVLSEAPARSADDEEATPEAQRELERRRRRGKQDDDDAAASTAPADDGESASAAPAPVDVGREKALPRVPPDPRMARLHALLPSSPASPPTTSSGRGRKGS